MEKELSLEFLRTVETAAIASARTMGQGDRSGSDQAAVEAMRSEMDRVGNRTGHYRAFISLLRSGVSWEAARNDYAGIAVPVLLVWGDGDQRSPLTIAAQFRAAIPGAELAVIPNAGHVSNMEQPEEFNSRVRQFCLSNIRT